MISENIPNDVIDDLEFNNLFDVLFDSNSFEVIEDFNQNQIPQIRNMVNDSSNICDEEKNLNTSDIDSSNFIKSEILNSVTKSDNQIAKYICYKTKRAEHFKGRHPLYRNPNLYRYDSLIHFPNYFIKYFNSGNFIAIEKLLDIYSDKSCTTSISSGKLNSYKSLKIIFNNICDVRPDSYLGLKDIKVQENKIYCKFHYEGTVNITLNQLYSNLKLNANEENYYNSLVEGLCDNDIYKILQNFDLKNKTQDEINDMVQILKSRKDFRKISEMDFIITFHYVRNKRKAIKYQIDRKRLAIIIINN